MEYVLRQNHKKEIHSNIPVIQTCQNWNDTKLQNVSISSDSNRHLLAAEVYVHTIVPISHESSPMSLRMYWKNPAGTNSSISLETNARMCRIHGVH